MKRLLIALILIVLISIGGFAQKWKLTRYESTLGVGTANYFGDIGGSADNHNWYGIKDIQLLRTRPTLSAGLRYKIDPNNAIKVNLNYGWISGSDIGSVNAGRNYKFNTQMFETSVQYEYSILSEDNRVSSFALFNKRGMLNNYSKLNLYSYVGAGSLFFFPSFVGKLIDPKDEIITGYNHVALVIPAGIGLKIIYSSKLSLGFEFGGRVPFTDYLDGFSSKMSKWWDLYYFSSVNIIYRLRTSRKGLPIIFKD